MLWKVTQSGSPPSKTVLGWSTEDKQGQLLKSLRCAALRPACPVAISQAARCFSFAQHLQRAMLSCFAQMGGRTVKHNAGPAGLAAGPGAGQNCCDEVV